MRLRSWCRALLPLALSPLLAATAVAAPDVVASIKPIHSLVAGVMQGVGQPALLLSGAGSPHDYSLRPSDARRLESAELVFWIGPSFETFLVKPLQVLAGDALVVALSRADGVSLLPTREGGVWNEHDHGEHDREDEHGQGHEEDHADFDLHLWLDPHNARAMVAAIVHALAAADPDHAARYDANGQALGERLAALDATLEDDLAPVAERPFMVFHDAYHYFAERYGLTEAGAITVDPQRRPGAQRLAEIRARVLELGAVCVFAEPQFEPALVETVVDGTPARKGVLDPLGSALEAGPDQYFELMGGLAGALLGCLDARSG